MLEDKTRDPLSVKFGYKDTRAEFQSDSQYKPVSCDFLLTEMENMAYNVHELNKVHSRVPH